VRGSGSCPDFLHALGMAADSKSHRKSSGDEGGKEGGAGSAEFQVGKVKRA